MQKRFFSVFFSLALALIFCSGNLSAAEPEGLLEMLLHKGVITQQEYDKLKSEAVLEAPAPAISADGGEPGRVALAGALQIDYRWMDHRGLTAEEDDNTSDLYIRRAELGLRARVTDWARTTVVLNSEWVEDSVHEGDNRDNDRIKVDEAILTLKRGDSPLYVIAGKRPQPFGVFENHLVTDPMTQDAYEIKKVGFTSGLSPSEFADVSVTVYKGEEMMDRLFQSGLFDSAVVRRRGNPSNDLGSVLVSSSAPVDDYLIFFASYLSEPGRGVRNETATVGLHLDTPFFKKLRIDGEYMKALNRERYEGLNDQFREGVLSITAAYEFTWRARRIFGGALFAEQRAHLVSEPTEVAARYEHFYDDGLARATGTWSVRDRYSFGGRHSFYWSDLTGLNIYLAGEFRRSILRSYDPSVANTNNNEIYARLGVEF